MPRPSLGQASLPRDSRAKRVRPRKATVRAMPQSELRRRRPHAQEAKEPGAAAQVADAKPSPPRAGRSGCACIGMLAAAAAAALLVFRVVVVHPQWVRRPGLPSATWDGVIAFRPAAVVRAATVQDVEDAVRAAVSSGTTLKALGSGHSWSGAADPTGEPDGCRWLRCPRPCAAASRSFCPAVPRPCVGFLEPHCSTLLFAGRGCTPCRGHRAEHGRRGRHRR